MLPFYPSPEECSEASRRRWAKERERKKNLEALLDELHLARESQEPWYMDVLALAEQRRQTAG